MKNIVIAGIIAALLLGGGVWWSKSLSSGESGVINSNGFLHWHPQLEIYIKGVKQEIPTNIGVGVQYASGPTYDPVMRMTAVHTHDDLPLIHLEFSGKVTEEDIKLGNFFRIWGKEFSSSQLLEHRNGPEGKVSMLVNGQANAEFENYHMRDGDRIELRYE